MGNAISSWLNLQKADEHIAANKGLLKEGLNY